MVPCVPYDTLHAHGKLTLKLSKYELGVHNIEHDTQLTITVYRYTEVVELV